MSESAVEYKASQKQQHWLEIHKDVEPGNGKKLKPNQKNPHMNR